MEALQALSNEIGQPGAEKLYRAVERRNLPYNRKQVADFVRAQSTRQVFHKRPKYEGKITAVKINDRAVALPWLQAPHEKLVTATGFVLAAAVDSQRVWVIDTP